ncbi:UbiA family prenyltransferase [Synechococcus elongatus IITB5]
MAGGAFAAAADTLNCLYDRDIDAIMERTRWRPLPSGRVQPIEAWIFARAGSLVFHPVGLASESACRRSGTGGNHFLRFIYTHSLKRHSSQNIVIGGAAGAIHPWWAGLQLQESWLGRRGSSSALFASGRHPIFGPWH